MGRPNEDIWTPLSRTGCADRSSAHGQAPKWRFGVARMSAPRASRDRTSDCKRISGLYVGACWLRATTGIRTSESQSHGETSKATLVSGFIARRSDLFRHGAIATQFGV